MSVDVGDELELTVGDVAHGGHCVARVGDSPEGLVVFVRHALPGERVTAQVTATPAARARATWANDRPLDMCSTSTASMSERDCSVRYTVVRPTL